MKTLYVLGVVLAYLAFTNCAPTFFDDELDKLIQSFKADCSKKFKCPEGSSSCSQNTTTSEDRQTIRTEVKCFDSNGQLLDNGNGVTTEENKNPNGIHNSYVYYGSFSSGSNTVHTTNYGNSNPSNTKLETFDV